MDVNNLDMFVSNHGNFAYDIVTGNAGLIYPKGSGKTAMFSAGVWMGAKVGGEPFVSTADYGWEFVPGPMANGSFLPDQLDFKCYRIDRGNTTSPDYLNWPVSQGAPLDQDGHPLLLGDATIWSVYNDADWSVHLIYGNGPLGVEVQQTTFAFNRAGPLSNTVFFLFKIANKGGVNLEDMYFSLWADPDVGRFNDDLAGCDTTNAMGYAYNGSNDDAVYGSAPPAVGVSLLRGPMVPSSGGSYPVGMSSFVKYINGTDPANFVEVYNYLQGLQADGSPVYIQDDPNLPITTFMLSGDPVTGTGWVDTLPTDARITVTTGPFPMPPGQTYDIAMALVIGQGSDRLSSVTDLRNRVQAAKRAYDDLFAEQPGLHVDVDIDPDVINLRSHAPWLTAYLEPTDFGPESIASTTVSLEGVPAEGKGAVIGDHDGDGLPDLKVRFARAAIDPLLFPGTNELRIRGRLVTGEEFGGEGEIQVMDPGQGPASARVRPNPINPSGILTFTTAAPGNVTVRLFDLQGHVVRTVAKGMPVQAGAHELRLDGRGDGGDALASGVYFYRIETAEGALAGRVAILK